MVTTDAKCGRSNAAPVLCFSCRWTSHLDLTNCCLRLHMNRADILVFFCCWFPFGLHIIDCYDGYSSCQKPYRTSRGRMDLPCDFNSQNWCIIPGSAYPWHAVRRFVFENHGLMRRMYGEQRHISVLRAEIDSNDVEYNEGWHGYHESTFKRYEKPTPTPLRQASMSSATTSTSTSTSTTTTTTTTTTANPTAITNMVGNTTYSDGSYNSTDEEEEEEEIEEEIADVSSSTENILDTTISEELPPSSTASSSAETSKTSQAQIFQQTSSESPIYRHRGINACPVKEEVVAPFWANNTRGEILALLNLYPFEQYVHWERCTYENKQMYCRQGCRCEQQYRLYRLLAYDPTNDCRGIFSDWFKFPSCCVCKCYDLPADLRITSRSPRGKEPKFSVPASWNIT